jgi:hypothetical protein
VRSENLRRLEAQGFSVAASLPTKSGLPGLRPARDIATRLMALEAVFRWVVDAQTPTRQIRAHAERNGLVDAMTDDEPAIFRTPRKKAHAAHVHTIGWRLERMWPLAWTLGFEPEPTATGEFIDASVQESLCGKFLAGIGTTVEDFLVKCSLRPSREVSTLEDLFYCAHNAVRSAQLGKVSCVPEDFDPIVNGGVIHERRWALTWSLSAGVAWDDVDLST